MKGMIFNANTRTLDNISPNLPNMENTIMDWMQTIIFTMIKKTTENFQVIEKETKVVFQGIVENIKPSNLDMKPEGQRKWRWISVWSSPELELQIDDRFNYQHVNYRVMSKNDWSVYGYVQYECMEDYEK